MITYEKKSGWAGNFRNIRYVSIWDKSNFIVPGQMKFYGGDAKYVVDVSLEGNTVLIDTYPHNGKDEIPVLAEKYEEEIRKIILEARNKEPERLWFTVDLEKGPVLVVESFFTRYMPMTPFQNELYYIDTKEKDGGFPKLFLYEETQRRDQYKNMFSVMAMCSDILMGNPTTDPTPEGADFVYMFLNSWLNGSFTPECPGVHSMRFPQNGDVSVTRLVNTEDLDKLLCKAGVENVIMKNGEIVLVPDAAKKEPKSENEVFGKPDKKSLQMLVMKDIKEMNQVNLSDAFQLGFPSVLAMALSFDSKPIDVFVDIENVAKKMCIYEGQVHVILKGNTEQDLVNFLDYFEGTESDVFSFCDEDTFPKNLLANKLTHNSGGLLQ